MKEGENICMNTCFKVLIKGMSLMILFSILGLSCRQTTATASASLNDSIIDKVGKNKIDSSNMENEVFIQINGAHDDLKWKERIRGQLAIYLLHLHESPNGHASHGKIRILTGYPFAEFHVGKTIYKWEGNDILINELTDMEYPFPYGKINTMEENDHDIPPLLSQHLSPGRLNTLQDIKDAYTAVLLFWEDKYQNGIH